jgi:pimeloyl-ACP methyl ester carboxylesterase
MVDELSTMTNMFIIGHSLGGIYALHIANMLPDKVIGAVTLSTPYGGCEVADFVKYLVPASRLLRDIGPRSEPIVSVNKLHVIHPWINLVSTIGNSSWIPIKNDGVVSIASMKYRKDMSIIDMPTNHYEIVLLPETVNIIKTRLGLSNENI